MKKALFIALLIASGYNVSAQESPPKFIVSEPPDSRFLSFDKSMIEFMERRSIPGGTLAVVKEGRLVYAQGYGFADKERKEKARATSLFRIASISKPITSLALLHLMQEKSAKISLETR
ncbi:MAG: serine hydrolase, partial [Armatimonadetes bacterium]|nr:serine hydrolase [Armatimonadota bacterium]